MRQMCCKPQILLDIPVCHASFSGEPIRPSEVLAGLPLRYLGRFGAALTLISLLARARNISFDVSDISFDVLYIIFALFGVNEHG